MTNCSFILVTVLCGSVTGCSGGGMILEVDADADEPGDDAVTAEDAPPSDDAGLAPPCEDVPRSCLSAIPTATVEVNRQLINPAGDPVWPGQVLQGLSVRGSAGPSFLFVLPVPTADLGGAIDHLKILQFDSSGTVSRSPLELGGPAPSDRENAGGDILALADDSTMVVWSARSVYATACPTVASTVAPDGAIEAEETVHNTDCPESGQAITVTSAVASGRVWIVSAAPGELTASPLDDPSLAVRVSFGEARAVSRLRAAGLPDGRIVIAWSAQFTDFGGTAGVAAVFDDTGVVVEPTTVFPPSGAGVGETYLAVNGAAIYLARYDREDTALRDGRIRVARLDYRLQRTEPDRWINGWGGVTPGGMALLAWRGGVWVVFQTLDARYATNPVLYAEPLAVPDCGYAVDTPVAVFPPHWAFSNSVLAAPGDDEIWVVVAYLRDNATADLFRLVPCD